SCFFLQAEDGIRAFHVTGVQTCALPISLYESKGVTPDKDVVAYCRIGERSAHTWFVLHELLGYDKVRNYDGSWTEYGSLVDVPRSEERRVGTECMAGRGPQSVRTGASGV